VTNLFDSVRLGAMTLPNRIVMAPMTRNRAEANGNPNEMMAKYYEQRASFGLIITEGTQPAAVGQGYPRTSGMHTDAHEAGWREIASRVHNLGGHLFIQLMHSGRVGHREITGLSPIGPSPIAPAGKVFTGQRVAPFEIPKAMDRADLAEAKASFVGAALRAIAAGCDGVEIHAANGYLLQQFLSENSNHRTDDYGGSPERRAAFVIETMEAIAKAIGAARIGIRISPGGASNDILESEIEATYGALLDGISPLGLAYLHVIKEPTFDGITFSRDSWNGSLIVNTGLEDQDKVGSAKRLVEDGIADLVSFARLALANPDLPRRIKESRPFNVPDRNTFYTNEEAGYIDYPVIT
jgi:N-ethylmaleimide reductase